MASQSVSTFAAALKTLYPGKGIEQLVYPTNAFFAMVKKSTDFVGENLVIPVSINDVAGTNSSFASAQDAKAGSVKKKFVLTRKKEYGLASIDNELIEASATNAGAFVAALKEEMDSAFRAVGRRIGQAMYRDGSGKLATIGSTTNTATTSLVLANTDDVVNFGINDQLVFAASTAANIRTATALTVTAIDEDTGTLTLSATPDSLSASIAAGDAIFKKGDYATANDKNRLTGLDGWIPSSAPATSDSFFGLNRSVHATRLAGWRVTGTSLQIDEAIYKAAIKIGRTKGKADTCFLNFSQFEVLQNVLGNKADQQTFRVGEVGFDYLRINGPSGSIKVVPDYNCQPDVAWVGDLSAVELCSLGKAPHILGLESDGLRLLRESSSDAAELRVGFYGNLAVRRPYHWARVSLTVPT